MDRCFSNLAVFVAQVTRLCRHADADVCLPGEASAFE